MDEPLIFLETPAMRYLAVILAGVLIGLIADRISVGSQWIGTVVLIGICGAWLGSRLAEIADVALTGTAGQLLAALCGAVILIFVWRQLLPLHNEG